MWSFGALCDRMKAAWRWSNSHLFQVTSPLSVCQSHSAEGEGMREHYNWRESLPNNAKSLTFPVPPPCTAETCQNPTFVTVSQGSLWIQQWAISFRLVTCYLCHVLFFDWITHSFSMKKKKRKRKNSGRARHNTVALIFLNKTSDPQWLKTG